MSVILFRKDTLYQQLADAYEGLKHLRRSNSAEGDERFYKSLRRLYFANVATYLCQYHDDTPLTQDELKNIETFDKIQGRNYLRSDREDLHNFLEAWGSLQYSLVTNDGEQYEAKQAYALIVNLAEYFSREVIRNLVNRAK